MSPVQMSTFANTVMTEKYLHPGEERWEDVADRVVTEVVSPYLPDLVEPIQAAVRNREFMPGGRYLAAAGSAFPQTQNCLLLFVADNREAIGDLFRRSTVGGMTGAGIGVVWSRLRPRGARVGGNGGTSTGPCSFMQSLNEIGRGVVNGGSRRMAIWAGLHWYHPDVFEFMALKDWNEHVVAGKAENFSAYAPLDMTNISVILDTAFFDAIEDPEWSHTYEWQGMTFEVDHAWAQRVYWTALERGLKTGEPGFSVDADENEGENGRNACTEVTTYDDNDICNLGSINLARVNDIDRFTQLVDIGTAFLLCGTLYSTVPYPEVAETREKNRRLGLGIMGVYEWLVKRGYRYEPNDELAAWLEVYASSGNVANRYADRLGVSRPVKTRAIAPTGTIGILAETTTGIEPLFAVAYKRRYMKDNRWHFQYVVDATAQRMIDQGVSPENLETAYDLANDPGRRLAFQAFVQRYVDHGISSTLNLPNIEDQPFTVAEFGDTLFQHLRQIRGVTVYPNGARGGQPLEVVSYEEAAGFEGLEYEEYGADMGCKSGTCGI